MLNLDEFRYQRGISPQKVARMFTVLPAVVGTRQLWRLDPPLTTEVGHVVTYAVTEEVNIGGTVETVATQATNEGHIIGHEAFAEGRTNHSGLIKSLGYETIGGTTA